MTTAPAPMISSSAPAVVVAALATARALAHKWIEPVLAPVCGCGWRRCSSAPD